MQAVSKMELCFKPYHPASVQATMCQACRITSPSSIGLQTWGWTCQRWAAGSSENSCAPMYERHHCLSWGAMLRHVLTTQCWHTSALADVVPVHLPSQWVRHA